MNSELQTWLALLGPAAVLAVALAGGLRMLFTDISSNFHKLDDKLDDQTRELTTQFTALYRDHEAADVARHVENVQRLAKLETTADGNVERLGRLERLAQNGELWRSRH
jgi:hypothetical protein